MNSFEEFFESGLEDTVSPFLTPSSRKWGKNIRLKSVFIAALLLLFSLIFSFFPNVISISHLFLLLAYFFAGIPALISSVEDLYNFEINIDVLMTLAAFLSVLIGSGKEGALLLVLFSFSEALEGAVRNKAKGALSSLKTVAPQTASVVLPDQTLIERSVKDVEAGTFIHIKAGEVIPLDGVVVKGSSSINLVHLTGESLPITCTTGDTLPAGGHNLEGAFTLKVTRSNSHSTLTKMIQLITEAQNAKPKLQRWVDAVTKRYALLIIILSFCFALFFPLFFPIPYLGNDGSIYRSLAFLIAASPCALIIAIPIAYLSAISSCAKKGILLKGAAVLDALAKCQTLALDKTGTLTKAELSCLGVISNGDQKTLLSLGFALEQSAVHPIAQAIIAYAKKEKVVPASISNFRFIPGFGAEAIFESQIVRIGNPEWLLPSLPFLRQKVETLKSQGEIVTLLTYGKQYALFRFQDQLRSSVKETLKKLKEKWKIRLLMLTGDHEKNASLIAKEAGVTEYYANLSPEEKLELISKEKHLAMIGDGMNDAPSLARASVGISMGKIGSGVAIHASDIVLLQDRIDLIEWLINKAHQVVRIVAQNVFLAATGIVFALIPALLGWLPLWVAVCLHEGGTVIVGLNALRLLKKS